MRWDLIVAYAAGILTGVAGGFVLFNRIAFGVGFSMGQSLGAAKVACMTITTSEDTDGERGGKPAGDGPRGTVLLPGEPTGDIQGP